MDFEIGRLCNWKWRTEREGGGRLGTVIRRSLIDDLAIVSGQRVASLDQHQVAHAGTPGVLDGVPCSRRRAGRVGAVVGGRRVLSVTGIGRRTGIGTSVGHFELAAVQAG